MHGVHIVDGVHIVEWSILSGWSTLSVLCSLPRRFSFCFGWAVLGSARHDRTPVEIILNMKSVKDAHWTKDREA